MPNVLVFESDSKFAGELKGELEKRGCAVTVVDDAAVGLQTASVDKPDLILLAIELPRMNGFSVCNKLKRDPGLKEVPLIIMSSDSTEETFEQHRRLRTHAEDYIHKPIAFVDLLPRISAVLPLPINGESAAPPEDDIIIDDDVAFVEGSIPPPPPPEPTPAGTVDDEVDRFTESAFGNMVEEEPPPLPPLAPAPVAMEPAVSQLLAGAEAPIPEALDLEPMSLPESAIPPPPPPPPPAPVAVPSERPAFATSIPPRPRADSVDQSIRDENVRLVDKARDLEKEARDARARIAELEDDAQRAASKDAEVQRLQRELDDVKAKAAAGPGATRGGGSAREFLDLREALNKKDKELLDLRDQLSHKEKDLLGLRDTNLAGEREKADLSDRIADLEKQSGDMARQLDGARADKDQAAKRADDFKRKGEKLQSELDAKTADAADLKQKLDEELAARATREAGFETQLREAAERAEQVRTMSVTAAEERGLERGRTEATAEAGRLLADAAANSTREKEDAVRAREAELRQEHEGRTDAVHRAHDDAIGRLKAEHTQMLADEDKASLTRIQDLENSLNVKHETELNQQLMALTAARSELADVVNELAALKEQKAQGDASRDARITSLEHDVTERTNELYSTQGTLRERETSLGAATANLAALGQELTDLQNQVVAERARVDKAHAKWTEDRASLERAKDAMAAALAQMDEIEGRVLE
jgi:CheY-like chemotaxis protein